MESSKVKESKAKESEGLLKTEEPQGDVSADKEAAKRMSGGDQNKVVSDDNEKIAEENKNSINEEKDLSMNDQENRIGGKMGKNAGGESEDDKDSKDSKDSSLCRDEAVENKQGGKENEEEIEVPVSPEIGVRKRQSSGNHSQVQSRFTSPSKPPVKSPVSLSQAKLPASSPTKSPEIGSRRRLKVHVFERELTCKVSDKAQSQTPIAKGNEEVKGRDDLEKLEKATLQEEKECQENPFGNATLETPNKENDGKECEEKSPGKINPEEAGEEMVKDRKECEKKLRGEGNLETDKEEEKGEETFVRKGNLETQGREKEKAKKDLEKKSIVKGNRETQDSEKEKAEKDLEKKSIVKGNRETQGREKEKVEKDLEKKSIVKGNHETQGREKENVEKDLEKKSIVKGNLESPSKERERDGKEYDKSIGKGNIETVDKEGEKDGSDCKKIFVGEGNSHQTPDKEYGKEYEKKSIGEETLETPEKGKKIDEKEFEENSEGIGNLETSDSERMPNEKDSEKKSVNEGCTEKPSMVEEKLGYGKQRRELHMENNDTEKDVKKGKLGNIEIHQENSVEPGCQDAPYEKEAFSDKVLKAGKDEGEDCRRLVNEREGNQCELEEERILEGTDSQERPVEGMDCQEELTEEKKLQEGVTEEKVTESLSNTSQDVKEKVAESLGNTSHKKKISLSLGKKRKTLQTESGIKSKSSVEVEENSSVTREEDSKVSESVSSKHKPVAANDHEDSDTDSIDQEKSEPRRSGRKRRQKCVSDEVQLSKASKTTSKSPKSTIAKNIEDQDVALHSGNSPKTDIEFIDLAKYEDTKWPPKLNPKVCRACRDLWNDEILHIIFKGTECVTVNSKITYGAIVCINNWINRNLTGNKEQAITNIFERADLGKNIAKLNISRLDQWLDNLLQCGKHKCCDVFTAVYGSDREKALHAKKQGKKVEKKVKTTELSKVALNSQISHLSKSGKVQVPVSPSRVYLLPKAADSLSDVDSSSSNGQSGRDKKAVLPAATAGSLMKPCKLLMSKSSGMMMQSSSVVPESFNEAGTYTFPVQSQSNSIEKGEVSSPQKQFMLVKSSPVALETTPSSTAVSPAEVFSASKSPQGQHKKKNTKTCISDLKPSVVASIVSPGKANIALKEKSAGVNPKVYPRKVMGTSPSKPLLKKESKSSTRKRKNATSPVKAEPHMQQTNTESKSGEKTNLGWADDSDDDDDLAAGGDDDGYSPSEEEGILSQETQPKGKIRNQRIVTSKELLTKLGLNLKNLNIYSSYMTGKPMNNRHVASLPKNSRKRSPCFFKMLQERSALYGMALEAFDLLLYESHNLPSENLGGFEENRFVINRFVTKRELLTLQSIFILNPDMPDVNLFYQIFIQILFSRNQVLLVPDSRALLVVTENIRKEYNRARLKKTSCQVLNENWDPLNVYSTDDLWLTNEETKTPTNRDIISVFCAWKNLGKKVPDPSFNKALQALGEKIDMQTFDRFGLCIGLYAKLCRYLYEEKNVGLAKFFLDEVFTGPHSLTSKKILLIKMAEEEYIQTTMEYSKSDEKELEDAMNKFTALGEKAVQSLNEQLYGELSHDIMYLKEKLEKYRKVTHLLSERSKVFQEKKKKLFKHVTEPEEQYYMTTIREMVLSEQKELLAGQPRDGEGDGSNSCSKRRKIACANDRGLPDYLRKEEVSSDVIDLIEDLLFKGVKPDQVRTVINTVMANVEAKEPLKLPSEKWIKDFFKLVSDQIP